MREASMPQVKAAGSKPAVSPQQKIANLFQQIDTAGSGHITKAQFVQAFDKVAMPPAVKAAGAEAAFSKLDPTGSGSVSKQDFIKGMEALASYGVQSSKAAAAKTAAPQAAASQAAAAPKAAATPQASTASGAPDALASAPVPGPNGPIGNTINITA